MQIQFLSTATHKFVVTCVSGKCRRVGICRFHFYQQQLITWCSVRFGEVPQGEEGLSVPQGPCIMHFFTISCKTGSSLALGISAFGELYKCKHFFLFLPVL